MQKVTVMWRLLWFVFPAFVMFVPSLSITDEPCWWRLTPVLKADAELTAPSIYLVTHASRIWDNRELVKESVNRHIDEARRHHIPVVYLVHELNAQARAGYYVSNEPDFLYKSEGGEFKVRLHTKVIYLSGGYFACCAAETALDAVLATAKTGVQINYLTDSLYTSGKNLALETLKNVLKPRSDAGTLRYLRRNYFSYYFYRSRWGPGTFLHYPTLKNFTFRVLRDGREIGVLGNGPREVVFNFIVDTEPIWPFGHE